MSTGSLDHLGKRILILGPSNSGKSTLAQRLGDSLGVPVCHLDQIAHRPHTKWERLPHEEFRAKHDAFVARESWVIDGNYSSCIAPRLERASAVIWLDPPLVGCIWRYLRRCYRRDAGRAGNLEGAQSQFSFNLILYTLQNYPKNKKKYRSILGNYPQLKQLTFKKLITLDDLCA